MVSVQERTIRSGTHHSHHKGDCMVVVTGGKHDDRRAHSTILQSQSTDLHVCEQRMLGGRCEWDLHQRRLIPRRTESSHKCSGDVSSVEGSSKVREFGDREGHTGELRHDHSVLSAEAGGNSFLISLQAHNEHSDVASKHLL